MRFSDLFESEETDRIHGRALRQTGYWGRAGAGCIFFARSTRRFLLAHRSDEVEQPHTWGSWGGAIDPGENPVTAMQREAREEAGHAGPFEIIPLYVFADASFRYYNFCTLVDDEFAPHLGWETQGYRWCEWGRWPRPLHFGLTALFSDPASANTLRKLATAESHPST